MVLFTDTPDYSMTACILSPAQHGKDRYLIPH
jgi:hypothetical protein